MNNVINFLSRAPAAREACTILQARDADVLDKIGVPGMAAAIWQRDPLPGLADWLAALPVTQWPDLRATLQAAQVAPFVLNACMRAGMPAGDCRDMLVQDVAVLAARLAGVMGNRLVNLRLGPVLGDACRRFHVDQVPARLLCTYRGRGTQLALPGSENAPQELPAGWVAILRGSQWPGGEETRLLHRSPPISDGGEARLLLVIDPPALPDPDRDGD